MTEPADAWETTALDVRRALRDRLADATPAAMAVVVAVDGTAYRRPGARMVVTREEAVGAITAGCLEGPVARLSRDALDDGRAAIETYDLTGDEDEAWGMGLGCNGVIDVFVDPVDGSLRPALDAVDRGESAIVCTVIESHEADVPVGARTVIGADGTRTSEGRQPIADDLLEALADEVGPLPDVAETRTVTVDGVRVLLDRFDPIPDLLLFGSQGDIRPVARVGHDAGFRAVVASPRGAAADPERFPAADEVRAVRAPDLAELVENPEHTYPVLMSHNFVDDRMALESLLATEVPYVGLMGPRGRFEELREELAADGRPLSDAELDRIATPVGLDVGADSPAEIAVSIVAEALAVHNGRSGGRLSETGRPVHPR